MKALSWLVSAVATTAVASSAILVAGGSSAASAVDSPPPLEEDFSYPGAGKILAEHGLKLFKGDGHIMFVMSVTPPDKQCALSEIQVEKHLTEAPYNVAYCFKTTGKKGWLTLEVPANTGIRSGTSTVEATATPPEDATKREKFIIPAGQYRGIDPGDDENPPKKVLVELRFGGK